MNKKTASLLLLIFTLVFSIIGFAENRSDGSVHYAIVVDAGSSGSRLYLYEYKQDAAKSLPYSLQSIYSKKVSPGLSEVDSSDLTDYISNLFADVAAKVPADQQAQTPVYFNATAGMRVMSPLTSENDYRSIHAWLQSHTPFDIKEVKTIPGQYEGLYDWLALNYLRGALINKTSTAGIGDMGGGSVELAFNTTSTSDPNVVALNIDDKEYHIYSKSYLGLGQDFNREQLTNTPVCYPAGYAMPDGKSGLGGEEQCQADAEKLVIDVHHASQLPAFADTTAPFYLISGFYYNYSGMLPTAAASSYQITPAQFASEAKTFCGTPYATLKENSKHETDSYLYQYCVNGSSETALLNTIGFSGDKALVLTNSYGGNNLSWTLGDLIFHLISSQS